MRSRTRNPARVDSGSASAPSVANTGVAPTQARFTEIRTPTILGSTGEPKSVESVAAVPRGIGAGSVVVVVVVVVVVGVQGAVVVEE